MFNGLFKSKERKIYDKMKEGKIKYSTSISFLEYVDPGDEGLVFPIKCKNGKEAKFKVVSLTPLPEYGSKNVKLLFMGYVNEKPVDELTYDEFIESKCMDVYTHVSYK